MKSRTKLCIFTALSCVATILITIPTPMGGFDAIVGVLANGVQGVISGIILIEVMRKTKLAQKMSIQKGIFSHDYID